MARIITVYDLIHAGQTMDKTRAEITKVLNESGLSLLNIILVLEMLAFDHKLRSME